MSEWITDRRPTEADGSYVFNGRGFVVHHLCVLTGEPWMPIVPPEPYVKPRRWTVVWYALLGGWTLRDNVKGAFIPLFDDSLATGLVNNNDEHREAAERIAAIYEEVMP